MPCKKIKQNSHVQCVFAYSAKHLTMELHLYYCTLFTFLVVQYLKSVSEKYEGGKETAFEAKFRDKLQFS